MATKITIPKIVVSNPRDVTGKPMQVRFANDSGLVASLGRALREADVHRQTGKRILSAEDAERHGVKMPYRRHKE